VIVTSNLPTPARPPRRTSRTTRIASIDIEWTKNRRIKNGNVPFCYSIVWTDVPHGDTPADLADVPFAYTSVYVQDTDETGALVTSAAAALHTATEHADVITGHQLCADLGVLAATATTPTPTVDQARVVWKRRRAPHEGDPRFVDTRYDSDHILCETSRRLVDVSTELGLDVTQPELGSKSMTALHRTWLTTNAVEARERVSVLNLRHSLSTAYVAARAAGIGRWDRSRPFNVNRALAADAAGAWSWLDSPTFTKLLEDPPCPSATARSSA
jgi:hypothetical protein